MTREEAIYVLRTESVEIGGNAVSVCRFFEAVDMAVTALLEQDVPDKDVGKYEMVPKSDMEIILHEVANRSKPMWISVKDRLPEPDVEVLLIAHGWNNREIYVGKLKRIEAERSWLTGLETKASDWTIWGFSYLKEPVVTHWMPLPKPPKED